jgi:hypothetical protein
VGTIDGGSGGGDANNPPSTDLVVAGGGGGGGGGNANPSSYAAIHLQLHRKNKLYHDKYTEHILNYATEWERILTTRITGHLRQSETLRVDLDHYGKKVEDLHKSINKTMTKGKIVGDENVDKLKRNEAKLVQARQEYDRFVNDLCGLMEEVMLRGWKDLHPLLVKMAQFDTTLSNEESTLLRSGMGNVAERLKGMRNEYPGLKPLGRLKELETWSLESLARANPSNQESLVVSSGGGEYASYINAPSGGIGLVHAGLLGSRSTDEMNAVGGGGGLFGGGMPFDRASSFNGNPGGSLMPFDRASSFNGNTGSDSAAAGGYGQQTSMVSISRTSTSDSGGGGGYDWATGGGGGVGGGMGNANGGGRPSAPSSGGFDWAAGGGGGGVAINAHDGGGRSSSYRAAPSSGGYPLPLSPHEGQSSMSSMLSTMQAAAPPPTLGDIYGLNNNGPSSMSRLAPAVPPPPPPMPPPPPPPAPSSQLSMYGNDHQGGGSYPVSLSSQSGSTNPFDDGGSTGGGSFRTLSIGGPPPAQAPYGNVYGAAPTSGGGGLPYDPFR